MKAPAVNPDTLELEVHAERKGNQGQSGDEPGLDLNRMTLDCRIVKSPAGKPLDFPATVKAGDAFPFPFVGREGLGQLLPTPDSQHPKVQKKSGRTFELAWEYRG